MNTDVRAASASPPTSNAPGYAEIDLAGIWRDVWLGRWMILAIMLAAAATGAAAAFMLPRYYDAKTTLIPVRSGGLSGALSSLGDLAALASLAGVKVGGGEDQLVETMALLRSRQFTLEFIRAHNLMPVMFARKWDAGRGAWDVPADEVPTDGDAYEFFDGKVRRISQDKKTGVITLTVRWKDPTLAASLANDLVERINRAMQDRAVQESSAVIGQLRAQLDQTEVVPLRQALFQVLESEVKRKTLAQVRKEYALRVVDPATRPDAREYVSPRPALYAVGGALVGFALGGLAVVLRRRLMGRG